MPELPTLETFARRPRDALMWVPRSTDVARIDAALRVAGARVVDVGAGTGLLAHLLDASILAIDPAPAAVRYHPVVPGEAATLAGPFDAIVVSWMEAGKDYREACARLAPVIVNAYDVEGGCGVMGQVDFAPFGFVEAASWRTPSFEDAAHALDHRGALQRKGHPGNRIDVLTREPRLVEPLRAAVASAQQRPPLAWEAEMDARGM